MTNYWQNIFFFTFLLSSGYLVCHQEQQTPAAAAREGSREISLPFSTTPANCLFTTPDRVCHGLLFTDLLAGPRYYPPSLQGGGKFCLLGCPEGSLHTHTSMKSRTQTTQTHNIDSPGMSFQKRGYKTVQHSCKLLLFFFLSFLDFVRFKKNLFINNFMIQYCRSSLNYKPSTRRMESQGTVVVIYDILTTVTINLLWK